jgi:hypothetical protein
MSSSAFVWAAIVSVTWVADATLTVSEGHRGMPKDIPPVPDAGGKADNQRMFLANRRRFR